MATDLRSTSSRKTLTLIHIYALVRTGAPSTVSVMACSATRGLGSYITLSRITLGKKGPENVDFYFFRTLIFSASTFP